MNFAHVELIQPEEKLAGYLPPSQPATLPALTQAIREGQIIWKVAKVSVNWRRAARTRRLQLPECQIKCAVIGDTGQWWFVRVMED